MFYDTPLAPPPTSSRVDSGCPFRCFPLWVWLQGDDGGLMLGPQLILLLLGLLAPSGLLLEDSTGSRHIATPGRLDLTTTTRLLIQVLQEGPLA